MVGYQLSRGRISRQDTHYRETGGTQETVQTSNAFEASAAHTAGQGSGALDGLRRKMRRQLDQLWLAVHASGEHLQIAALIGGR